MKKEQYIIAFDQGTSSSRAVLYNQQGQQLHAVQQELTASYPHSGWVEQDPMEILNTQVDVFKELVQQTELDPASIAAIGITNQRETTIVWDKQTGQPVYPAIVWQDRRTATYCTELHEQGYTDAVQTKTGLPIDAYFSATKLKWILDQVDPDRVRARAGELLFGTVDTWLIWHLTGGKEHLTDVTNASRTLLYNIHSLAWDSELLKLFNIPEQLLPEVRDCDQSFGTLNEDYLGVAIPIHGVAGDQQAALFGQCCFEKGTLKNTYGTGCFMLINTGPTSFQSKSGLLTTVAWRFNQQVCYALEGSVFVAGAAVQWLRDGLELVERAAETEQIAAGVIGESGVVVVPAFTGLGTPYWDSYARGAIFGLTRGTTQAHIVKATLESIAQQSMDVIEAMTNDTQLPLKSVRVDGGAAENNWLMQYQADILGIQVERPHSPETTARGAAYFAGCGIGLWQQHELVHFNPIETRFTSRMQEAERLEKRALWKKAVERTLGWEKNDS